MNVCVCVFSDPNDRTDEILQNLSWIPLNSNTMNYLNIGNELDMRDRLFAERFAKWEALFPLPELLLDNEEDDGFASTEIYTIDNTEVPVEMLEDATMHN